jgi:hypothetical protein
LTSKRGSPGGAPYRSPEAFRELVQSQREAIRALMEARAPEKKQRQGRRPKPMLLISLSVLLEIVSLIRFFHFDLRRAHPKETPKKSPEAKAGGG